MKKRGIILSLIGIIIVSVGLMIIVNKNTRKVIMKDGAMLALTLDGNSITEFPSSLNYRVEIDCTNGRGKVLPEDGTWKFSVDNIKGNIICNIDFYSKTTDDKLVNKIVGTLKQANYKNYTNDSIYPWTWNDTDKTWTSSNKGDAAVDSVSEISFKPNSGGNYQICYRLSTEEDADFSRVYINGEQKFYFAYNTTSYECENLGRLSTSDTIKVTYEKDGSVNAGDDEVSFYIQSISEMVNEGDAGYRYEGQNPNNYIWFNNEMWRIIGLIPTKVNSSGTTTNLVKIIRKDSLGGIAYDAKDSGYTGAWGSNTLYTLLNSYYYGKHDVTNEAGCYGYSNTSKIKCDYSVNGISSDATDYYGRMVKNVYWNTGASDSYASASGVYAAEKAKQTVQGKIGLMSVSDIGYAASSIDHNSTILDDDHEDIVSSNWLHSKGFEWTNTQYSSLADHVNRCTDRGYMDSVGAYYGYAYRPVVYLNENVYLISGSGAEADPYIIGM